MSSLQFAIDHISTARRYTKKLLDAIDSADWFRQPAGGVTHVAWQVGHLAVAEYGLAMKRIRGSKPEDSALIPDEFFQLFGKGSVSGSDSSGYPSPGEIRDVFDNVHRQAIRELRELPEESLSESSQPEHPMFLTKLGALHWTAQHEFTHAGQIRLLRRLLGNDPLW